MHWRPLKYLHVHHVHPAEEDPARWRHLRAICWHQWGEHCLYRNPATGWKCSRTRNDRVPWTFSWTTEMNADHIYPASTYPEKRWDEHNLQPLCRYHNAKKNNHNHIDYRPGHYHWWIQVPKWWLLLPFKILMWLARHP